MRNLWWLLVLLFLFGCKSAPGAGANRPPVRSEVPSGKGCIRLWNANWHASPYLFRSSSGEPSDLRFVGEQKGADWTLKSEGTDEPIEVTKKGDQIELVRSENRGNIVRTPIRTDFPPGPSPVAPGGGRADHDPSLTGAGDRGDGNRTGPGKKIGKIVEKQMGSQKAARRSP